MASMENTMKKPDNYVELYIASFIGWAIVLEDNNSLTDLEKTCVNEFKKYWKIYPPETDFTHMEAVCEVLRSVQECELFLCVPKGE